VTTSDSWHAAPDLLARYGAGELEHERAASVEAHLLACARCRHDVAGLVPDDRMARNLDAIHVRIGERVPVGERMLRRLGVPERTTRILAVTPSARVAWVTAVALAVVAALTAGDVDSSDQRTSFLFLVAAPLVPLAVVASAFAGRSDPVRELVSASPMPVLDLLLLRALAVLVPATLVLGVAALLVPATAGGDVLWLLPSLGLAGTTLALATRVPVRAAAWAVGAVWVAVALVSARGAPRADLIGDHPAFRPAGQLAFVALTLVAGVVVVMRRDAFEHVEHRSIP